MKIKKENIYTYVVPFIFIIFFLLIGIFCCGCYYEVDESVIHDTLFGVTSGKCSNFVVYINYFITSIVAKLANIFNSINWFAIILILFNSISFYVICIFLVKSKGIKQGTFSYVILGIIAFFPNIIRISYTYTSIQLIIAAILCLIYSTENCTKKSKIILLIFIATLLSLLGLMLRKGSIFYFVFYFIYVAYEFWFKKDKKRVIINFIAFICIIVLCGIINKISYNIYYSKNPNYCNYNESRTILNDYVQGDYESNKEILQDVGWSKNDFKLFFLFSNADDNVFSYEKVKYVASKINILKNIKLKRIIISLLIFLTTNLLNIVFLILILIYKFKFDNKKDKKELLFLILNLLAFIGINLIFIVMQKVLNRVCGPLFLYIEIIIICLSDYNKLLNLINKKELIYIFGLMFGCMCIYYIFDNIECKKDVLDYNECYEYLNSNQNKLYLYSPYSMQYRYRTRTVFNDWKKGEYKNIKCLGGWSYGDLNTLELKEKYNTDSLYNLLLEDNVYYVDSNVYMKYWTINDIVRFLREHYNENIMYKIDKRINDSYIVYKLYVK